MKIATLTGFRKKETENGCSERITILDISDIIPNPAQTRRSFDDEEITLLAANIKAFGMLQPVTVRERDQVPSLTLNGERVYEAGYELIAGERRWRAARRLGMKKIPCLIWNTDQSRSAMMSLSENLQRKNLSFFEEAEAYKALLDATGKSQTELAKELSVSQSALSNKIRLLRLDQSERDIILMSSLTERHARALIRIANKAVRQMILKKIIEKSLSAPETERLVDNLLNCAQEDESKKIKPRRVGVIRDMRFFFNTIERAVGLLGDAGIKAKSEQIEYEDYYEVIIKVPKKTI